MDINKLIKFGVGGAVATMLALSSFYTTDSGYKYIIQDTARGTLEVKQEPGIFFKLPFVTTIYKYNNVATISNGNDDNGDGVVSANESSTTVQFADTYTAEVPTTIRVRLSSDPEKLIKMHKEFRSYDNVVNSLMKKTIKDVVVLTATHYTGEEFFLGGLNEFKVALEKQLNDGAYRTKRMQVKVEQNDLAAVSSTNDNADKVQKQTRIVWKNVIERDSKGQPLISKNPLEEYGIRITQVTVGRPMPDQPLDLLLVTKKQLVAARINAKQKQETVREQAKAAQLEKEIEKRQAIQVAQKEKDLAVIAEQKRVEVERQTAIRALVIQNKQKDVAVVQKEKELEIAQANEAIQRANAIAAKHEANAIREKGLAEADVTQAKYLAKQKAKDIVMAEIELEKSKVVYPALKDVIVDMPDYYVAGGQSKPAPTSLDVYTTLGAVKQLKDSTTK